MGARAACVRQQSGTGGPYARSVQEVRAVAGWTTRSADPRMG